MYLRLTNFEIAATKMTQFWRLVVLVKESSSFSC